MSNDPIAHPTPPENPMTADTLLERIKAMQIWKIQCLFNAIEY